jgi:hypothetical protein
MRTLTKTTTHIALAKQYNDKVMQQVCELLNWTPDHYCQHQYDVYESFLLQMEGDSPKVLAQLRHSPTFRGFWLNEWNKRTKEDFIIFAVLGYSNTSLDASGGIVYEESTCDDYDYHEYMFVHSASRLMNDTAFLSAYEHILHLIFYKS